MTDFEYLDVEQRSEPWFKVRLGRFTASRLSDLMARSKRDGAPLKACTDYLREKWFEKQFGISFSNYVTDAMLEGQIYEEFAKKQYAEIKKAAVLRCGCWYNDKFVASPDGLVFPIYLGMPEVPTTENCEGIVEIKILRDNTFTEVLLSGVPEKHFLQIQGQLMASGKDWCDYVAVNLATKKLSIWRVLPNKETFKAIEEALNAENTVEEVNLSELYDIQGEIPALALQANPSTNEGNPWLA